MPFHLSPLRFLAGAIAILALLIVTSPRAEAQRRVALVIGNAQYQNTTPLRNPVNDATDMAAALSGLGFEVVFGTDLDYREFRRKIREFAEKLVGADVGLLFYAGHGLQVSGRNYVAPVDATLRSEVDIDIELIAIDILLKQMEREAKTNIVLLDACRNNPLARSLARSMGTRSAAVGSGLARIDSGIGTFIAFATQPGNVAYDGEGRNSPFTAALVKYIGAEGLDITSMMIRVRNEVHDNTGGRQVPWENSSLLGQFYFKPGSPPQSVPNAATTAAPASPDIELAYWRAIAESSDPKAFETFLEKFPDGIFADPARRRIDALRNAAPPPADAGKMSPSSPDPQSGRDTRKAKAPAAAPPPAGMAAQPVAAEPPSGTGAAEPAPATPPAETAAGPASGQPDADAAPETRIAALTGDDGGTENAAEPENETAQARAALVRALQTELNRVGCKAGKVDGKWGRGSQRALDRFLRFAGLDPLDGAVSAETLSLLREKTNRVCPLTCGPRYRVRGDRCVLKKCPRGTRLTLKGNCVARRAFRKSEPIISRRNSTIRKTVRKPAQKSSAPRVKRKVQPAAGGAYTPDY